MQSSQNRPLPHEVDNRRRGSQQYYTDIYENPDQPAAQRSPTRDAAPQLPQQHQVPIEPGPQVANNASYRRGALVDVQRPPSYSGHGAPHEELLNKTNEAIRRRQEQTQQQQQPTSRRRGYRRTDESDDPSPPSTALPPNSRTEATASGSGPTQPNSTSYKQSLPNTRSRADPVPSQQSPRTSAPKSHLPRGNGVDAGQIGNEIPRLNSPSVMSSVLKPLNGKIEEYNTQMIDAQNLMDQLDAEMAALQERRREAETQFMAAKTKHDDYRRQYQGVERAMRGEPDMSFSRLSVNSERPSTQQTVQQHQRPRSPQNNESRARTESWNSLSGSKRESGRFNIRNLFG
ncbi:hypothetical protein BKA65DRAFT_36399 [Rhexocercosporidium sp. MPI-PUGE-AT-0058]|nr:hypothetical protein BKA65DRAFT_36399 [Rhexocercosporidium sp. MPI-PUGE-AT-0058]